MKKVIIIMATLALLLSGCGADNKMNTIAAVDEKTKEKFKVEEEKPQEKVDMLQMASYKVDKSFRSFKLTVEAYQDGELVEARSILEGSISDDGVESEGTVAMYFASDDEMNVLITGKNGRSTMTIDVESFFENQKFDNIASWTSVGIGVDDKLEVKDGEEYLLAAVRISTDPNEKEISGVGLKAIVEDMSVLNSMPYALLLKCSFSETPLTDGV